MLIAVKISTRDNAVVNRLNKTKVEREVDHEAERQERLRAEGRKKKSEAIERVSVWSTRGCHNYDTAKHHRTSLDAALCRMKRLAPSCALIVHYAPTTPALRDGGQSSVRRQTQRHAPKAIGRERSYCGCDRSHEGVRQHAAHLSRIRLPFV